MEMAPIRLKRPLLSLAFILLYLLASCSDQQSVARAHYHQVQAEPIAVVESYTAKGAFPGRVEAPQRFDIGFDAQGKVIEVNVNAGDKIEQGQVLARLDTSLLEAERSSVIAERKESEARLKLIGIDLKRQGELRRQGFASDQKIDELLAEQDALRAILDRIAASLVSVEERLEKTVIRAPFTGRIATRFVDPGEVVHVGAAIVRLLQGGSIELHVGIPVKLARHLKAGAIETVVIEDHSIEVPIISINSAVSTATQTIIVKLLLPEIIADELVFDGQIARLVIDEQRDVSGVWIPTDSLVGSVRGTWNMFVLQKNDQVTTEDSPLYKIVRRKINVVYMQGENTFVEGAFSSGELMLTAGLHRVAPGQLVTLSNFDRMPTKIVSTNEEVVSAGIPQ